jgi:hypothetical protein
LILSEKRIVTQMMIRKFLMFSVRKMLKKLIIMTTKTQLLQIRMLAEIRVL